MKIGDRDISSSQPPYIIAEIGVNHDGSIDRAFELVDASAEAGADAVKLQFFDTDQLLSSEARLAMYQETSGAKDPFMMLRWLELTAEQIAEVIDRAHKQNVHAIVTVFSLESVPDAAQFACDAFKTASPDVINRPLLEALMGTGKPLVVSTGAATLEEVAHTVNWLKDYPFVMMHCVSAYPTPDASAALAGRSAMRRATMAARGYSDHTTAFDTGGLAVASGASILEKHITYDRAANGPDHAASLNPEYFGKYVRLAHRAWRMRGKAVKTVLDIEQDVRAVSRQSLTATRDLQAGHILTRRDITLKRPGAGLPPAMLDSAVGRTLLTAIRADTQFTKEHLR